MLRSAFQLPDWGYQGQFAGAHRRRFFLITLDSTEDGMTRCDELVGKVIESFSLYEDGPDGPEILMEFTYGTLSTLV